MRFRSRKSRDTRRKGRSHRSLSCLRGRRFDRILRHQRPCDGGGESVGLEDFDPVAERVRDVEATKPWKALVPGKFETRSRAARSELLDICYAQGRVRFARRTKTDFDTEMQLPARQAIPYAPARLQRLRFSHLFQLQDLRVEAAGLIL